MKSIVIIGAGITGLAAAHRIGELAAARERPIEVTILERGARAGGPLKTVRRDGFTMETGADSFLTEKPAAADLARRLGLENDLIPTREQFRRTYVVHDGKLVEIPEGFSLLAPTHLEPVMKSSIFSEEGKRRIAMEPSVAPRIDAGDESLAAFVTRRLGREVLDRVAQPLAGGIYTADPERLSMAATMPRFVEMERRYGSLIHGLQEAEKARTLKTAGTSGARWSLFLSMRTGMGSLVDALAARVSKSLRFGADVCDVSRHDDGWTVALADGNRFDTDAIICAAPAFAAARFLKSTDAALAQALGKASYASAATVNLTFRESDFPKSPNAFGFVVPIIEHRKIIAGSFSSLKFEGRAPAGTILARAFVGGVLQNDMNSLPDDAIVTAVRDEFRALLGVTAAPGIVEVQRWPDSMPQYEVGHLDRVAEIERAAARLPRFVLAGAAYRGVGIPDCIRSGEQAAQTILDQASRPE
ncbi:MAG TPA: protoporphyrinogen oxidase [Candidatus Binataceae bacterium]|nr:protoporphyrinogen oxidase [Candidatus Binataceae bacterium]